MAHVPQQWPAVPEREPGHFLQPMRAEVVALPCDLANWLNGWKSLPCAHHEFAWSGDIYRTSPVGQSHTYALPFIHQPRSGQNIGIALVIDYQASTQSEGTGDDTALAGGVTIGAVLKEHSTGVNIDSGPACGWSVAEGTLAQAAIGRNVHLVGAAYFVGDRWPILQASTGTTLNTNPSNPTRPRPLLVPDTYAGGTELRVELTTVNVRLVHVTVWQLYAEDL